MVRTAEAPPPSHLKGHPSPQESWLGRQELSTLILATAPVGSELFEFRNKYKLGEGLPDNSLTPEMFQRGYNKKLPTVAYLVPEITDGVALAALWGSCLPPQQRKCNIIFVTLSDQLQSLVIRPGNPSRLSATAGALVVDYHERYGRFPYEVPVNMLAISSLADGRALDRAAALGIPLLNSREQLEIARDKAGVNAILRSRGVVTPDICSFTGRMNRSEVETAVREFVDDYQCRHVVVKPCNQKRSRGVRIIDVTCEEGLNEAVAAVEQTKISFGNVLLERFIKPYRYIQGGVELDWKIRVVQCGNHRVATHVTVGECYKPVSRAVGGINVDPMKVLSRLRFRNSGPNSFDVLARIQPIVDAVEECFPGGTKATDLVFSRDERLTVIEVNTEIVGGVLATVNFARDLEEAWIPARSYYDAIAAQANAPQPPLSLPVKIESRSE